MAKGETNTNINGKDYYRLTRVINGKKKQFYGTSKGNAESKYREYLEQLAGLKRSEQIFKDNSKLSDRAKEYIENVLRPSSRYAEGTKQKYEEAYRCHIKGTSFDDMAVQRIKASDVQNFYNGLKVSKQTMQNIQKFMKGFVRWLCLNDYAEDFLSAVEIPKKPDNKRHENIVVWSDEDIKTIADACVEPCVPFRASFMPLVLIYTGVRLGEALSLRYSDFADGFVNISRQYNLGEIKPPKYNSARQIPLHPVLQDALQKHMLWHTLEMKKNGYQTDYVFTTDSGRLYDPSNIRTALKRFYKRIGVEYKHPHAYRSTFCTQLCKSGVPIQTASVLMGHKNITVTAKFYTGIDGDTKVEAINKLNF